MKKVIYTCDKCGEEIKSVVYTLTCQAKTASYEAFERPDTGDMAEVLRQNLKENRERHLCGKCKDAITDGLFIV